MNAIELLKNDHDKVDKLFQKVDATEQEEHPAIFQKIKEELEVHMHIEETIFYPWIKENAEGELKDLAMEGVEEHRQAKMFIRELDNLTEDSERFDPKLKVLKEDIEHHVQEEEGQMFPKLEEKFDASALEELGKLMEEEKKSFKGSTKAASSK